MSETRAVRALPEDPATFVGREHELAEIRAALADAPLVTLVGPGGVGKTRLAVRAAMELSTSYEDGVAFVDLSAVTSGGGVGPALAVALGLEETRGADAVTAVADHLRGRACLVVIDNCEQVVDDVAAACDRFSHATDSRVLATSRVPLRSRAEATIVVEPLGLPDREDQIADSEAVRLFVERARRVRRPFTLDDSNARAVAELCRLLDGLPLAIELAAARVGAFEPAQLVAELRTHTTLLRDAGSARPDRHRSLAACIEWSFGLLDDHERVLIGRLSVFAGGFDLDAVRAACTDDCLPRDEIADVLGRLVDASIVAVDHRVAGRYRLLDTVRRHAARTSDDADRWRLRHLLWAESVASSIAARHASDDAAAYAAFVLDRENLFSAVDWAIDHGHAETGMRVLGSLWLVCSDFGVHEEVIRAVHGLQAAAKDVSPAARIGALLAHSVAAAGAGDAATGIAAATECAALAESVGDAAARAWALTYSGFARIQVHDPRSRDDLRVAIDLAEQAGDDAILADALVGLGFSDGLAGRLPDGLASLERGAVLAEQHAWLLPSALAFLGAARFLAGDLPAAVGAFDASLAASDRRPMRNHFFFTPFATAMRAIAASHTGEHQASCAVLEGALSSVRDEPHVVVRSLFEVGVGIVRQAVGDHVAAAAAYERSLVWAVDPFWGTWARHGLADLALQAGELDLAVALAEAIRRDATRHEHAYHLVRLDLLLAGIAAARDDVPEAVSRASSALRAAVDGGLGLLVPAALEAMSVLSARRGQHEVAARIVGAADGVRARTGHVRAALDAARLAAGLQPATEALGAVFERRREEAVSGTLDDVLTLALAGRGARRRPSLGWDSLTPAERNVVRLVADGLSNAEIGERLFISRRTVERHLANVFTKTGMTSRAQVAAETARRVGP